MDQIYLIVINFVTIKILFTQEINMLKSREMNKKYDIS